MIANLLDLRGGGALLSLTQTSGPQCLTFIWQQERASAYEKPVPPHGFRSLAQPFEVGRREGRVEMDAGLATELLVHWRQYQ